METVSVTKTAVHGKDKEKRLIFEVMRNCAKIIGVNNNLGKCVVC